MESPDPLTLIIKTKGPYPLMPLDLGAFGILSAQVSGAGARLAFKKGGCTGLGTPPKSVDFNDPAKAVGTGPYKLKEYSRGTQLVLERNDRLLGRPSRTGRRHLPADHRRRPARRRAALG